MPLEQPLAARTSAPPYRLLAGSLIGLGLAGHLYAAHAIGGAALAYQHHVMGFALILVVSTPLVAGLGRLFWRSRPALTWLVIGVIQLAFGAWMALDPLAAVGG